MIAGWMLYAAAVAALVAGAAAALEAVLHGHRRPTRGLWVLALLASVGIPAAGLLPDREPAGPAVASAADMAREEDPGGSIATGAAPRVEGPSAPRSPSFRGSAMRVPALPVAWSRWAMGGWVLLSILGALRMASSGWELRGRRRGWRPASVNGRHVLVAPDTGPAVVGLRKPEIVLPRWTLEMDPADRELMLRHEEEHRRAGDLPLVTAALGLLVAMPWSPALWWQLHRLRLAVEVDCDRRVLASRADVPRYGALLIAFGVRGRQGGHGAALAFARPMPFLERRIRLMTRERVVRPYRMIGLVALAALLVLGACRMERPPAPSPDGAPDRALQPVTVPEPILPAVRAPEVPSARAPESQTSLPSLQDISEPVLPEGRAAAAEAPVALAPTPERSAQERSARERRQEAQERTTARALEELARALTVQATELQEVVARLQESAGEMDPSRLEALARQLEQQQTETFEAMERTRELTEALESVESTRLLRALEETTAQLERTRVVEAERFGERSAAVSMALRERGAMDSVTAERFRSRVDSMLALARAAEDSTRSAMEGTRRDRGVIGGRVLAPDGVTPVTGVVITVTDLDLEERSGTDGQGAAGRFMFVGVPPGLHRLVFEHPDVGRWEMEVRASPNQITDLGDVIAPGR